MTAALVNEQWISPFSISKLASDKPAVASWKNYNVFFMFNFFFFVCVWPQMGSISSNINEVTRSFINTVPTHPYPWFLSEIAQMIERALLNKHFMRSKAQILVWEGFSLTEKNNCTQWIPDRIWTTMLKHAYQIYLYTTATAPSILRLVSILNYLRTSTNFWVL